MTHKYILGAVVVCMSLLTTYAHAIPTTYVYNGSGEITGVAALDINGVLWDMTLHDGSYTTVYQTIGADALYDHDFALSASGALVDFTNTQQDLAATLVGCEGLTYCQVTTVHAFGNGFYSAFFTAVMDEIDDSIGDQIATTEIDSTWFTFASWSTTAQGVPEPSVVLLIASGLMVFGIARRKDRT